VARAIHDRYDASLRNPYNEIECSDHYSRSMASYGAFLAACGYESHGPKNHLGFAPAFGDSTFKCAFTAAGGWGTFYQPAVSKAEITVKWGTIKLKTLGLRVTATVPTPTAILNGKEVPCRLKTVGKKMQVVFKEAITINANECLVVKT
jgi:hypothetical protein